MFNTNEPNVRMFNKQTRLKYDDINLPNYMFNIILTEWILESSMTDKEKKENPEFYVMGGYLKRYDYKEAWKNAWNKASTAEKKATKKLPNFNAKIFEEITGIEV